jgi:hypothetical protein
MRSILAIVVVVGGLLMSAGEIHAWAGGRGGGGYGHEAGGGDWAEDSKDSVPEPSTLWALGSGLALLGGAGWYIRRRK